MLHRNFAPLRLAIISAVASIAFLADSLSAQPVPGSYDLSFFKLVSGVLEPVSNLPVCTPSVCEELILNAHIKEDSSGLPAQGGVAIFQYCSLKGLPPNDITRADEAPSAACETGSATWANLAALKVNESGDAYLDFGVVLIPRTVGFRFKYIGQGSGIEKGISPPMDFTWVPAQ
jgi:hypothetical protein